MYKLKCPVCGDAHIVKNRKWRGVQTYLCKECGYRFRNNTDIRRVALWRSYQDGKQTKSELAVAHGVSCSTIKRRMPEIVKEWVQPQLAGHGYVTLMPRTGGHNRGVALVLDESSGKPRYMAFIAHERVQDYVDAVRSIEGCGYPIEGISTYGHMVWLPLSSVCK